MLYETLTYKGKKLYIMWKEKFLREQFGIIFNPIYTAITKS